jgi:two-component system sensor histidine kinase UhpB
MSLRARLLAAIFLALLISLSVGAGLAAWHAARTVHDELTASMANARRSTQAALTNLHTGEAGADELRRLVAAFDGSRHMRASLLAPDGRVVALSEPAIAPAPPDWFLHLVAPALPAAITPVGVVPGIAALRLQADPVSEAGERWAELRERIVGFGIFFTIAAALCSLTVAHSLRPLISLAQGLARVARGETSAAVAEAGPPEIATLAHAFNVMAAALREAEAQNSRLARQILTIAEEERAEIARNLHDEIGPLLFAITTFTAAIGRQVQTNDLAPVPAQLQAIQDATSRLQRDVRDMLGRLHEGTQAPANLCAGLTELAAFWRSVRPDILFELDIATTAENLPEAARECLFRAAQEGISNAVRHGRPRRVDLRLDATAAGTTLIIRDDGPGGTGLSGAGLGLPGMKARAAALGGTVTVAATPGWTLTMHIPCGTATLADAAAA